MSTDGPPNEPANEPPTAPAPPAPEPAPPPGSGGFTAPPPPNMPPPGAPPNIPPMSAPPGGAPPQARPGQFILGLLIGAIPLVLALIGLGSFLNASNPIFGYFLTAGGIGFVVGLVASIVLIAIQRTRRIGAGMLTALLASPIIFFIGCLVALARPFG
jgi:hypothetical protein